jgi:3-oxoadipate CoA-transferase alpha subunit
VIDKIARSVAEALEGLRDGATVMVGGFGEVGQPDALVDGVIDRGTTDLTLVSNNAGFRGLGVAKLIDLGRVRKIICSFPRAESDSPFERFYRSGRIELEIVPQGTLAERIRAGGAGIAAFYTPTGVGTLIGEDKEVRVFGGRPHVLEMALKADVALIEAWEADRWGNCTYRESGRNYNPIMAAAAELTIVQTQHLRALGAIPPDQVMTPGIYVQRVVQIDRGLPWTA